MSQCSRIIAKRKKICFRWNLAACLRLYPIVLPKQFAVRIDGGPLVNPLEQRSKLLEIEPSDSVFDQVYRDHYSAIAAYLYRRTGELATAEDLAADVFLAAFVGFSRYQNRGVPILHWLYRIATHEANRWAKRKRRNAFVNLDSTSPMVDGGSPLDRDDGIEEALAVMQTLSPKLQSVLTLHYLEGLSIQEVADVIGCRLGTVKSRLSRARDTLRKEIFRRKRT